MNNKYWLTYGLLIGCAAETQVDPAGPEDDEAIAYTWEQAEDGGCPDSWV